MGNCPGGSYPVGNCPSGESWWWGIVQVGVIRGQLS